MVLRIRKRPGMEREDVLAAPRAAGGSGGTSVWDKLLGGGGGTKPTPAVGACVHTRRDVCARLQRGQLMWGQQSGHSTVAGRAAAEGGPRFARRRMLRSARAGVL